MVGIDNKYQYTALEGGLVVGVLLYGSEIPAQYFFFRYNHHDKENMSYETLTEQHSHFIDCREYAHMCD